MGNTHPLNHVLLYWLSAAPGKSRKHPSSVSLNFPLRFLSPYQEAISAISTQGRFFPQHDKRRLEVLISGSKIRNQNCSLKLLPRGEVHQLSSVRSRTFNTVRSADEQHLRRANSTQALRRIFEKLKDASELIGWEPEKFILFSDNFPIRLFRSFNWPFTNGREFKFKSFTFWIWRRSQPALPSVLFFELSLNCWFFLLTIIKKRESEQKTDHRSSIDFLEFFFGSF
mgnify:FL=1